MSLMEYRLLGRTGERIPAIGLGTYGVGGYFGRNTSKDAMEVASLRRGMELEMTFIDTAESYGDGHSEEVVGEAIKGLREKVFIATKVSASHLAYDDVMRAAEGSLRRLGIRTIDLYQVHWANPSIPIKDTMRAMERLLTEGKIRYVGVSNFSWRETEEAIECLSRVELVSNQVRYSILDREIEGELLPICEREGVTVIAYEPLERGGLLRGKAVDELKKVGRKYGKTPAQVALNWLIRKPAVMAIPKASKVEHLEENAEAVGWTIDEEDYRYLRKALP